VIKLQVEHVIRNLQTALNASGARLEHIVKWDIYILQGQPLRPGFEASQQMWAGPANLDFLVEMDAIAVIPEG